MTKISSIKFQGMFAVGKLESYKDGEIRIRRPVFCKVTPSGTEMTRGFRDAEDELFQIFNAPGPVLIQAVSSSDDVHMKYLELTSPIHIVQRMPQGEEN